MDSHRRRRPDLGDFRVEATAFLYEVIHVADSLRDARTLDGESALKLGPLWRLLRAIERCGGAPTFSDLGRLLDMSRQGAREQALAAAETGLVELFPSHDDRRAWQVMLTPAGRRALEAQRMPDPVWLFTLLNGLDPAAMRSTQHVLRVIRLRLEGYARSVSAAAARR
jgi:DNA-binding MarR family transcriptional regulator